MLLLKDIVKNYETGSETVQALKGVSISFRKSEFVSILGQSGCGKTTLLNIIGGLDRYTSGDLIINGRSTKEYKDRDWDTYRNHSIGFVFQSYNLITHQTVLANVELALTLSGVSKEERRKRAISALERVGLGDQLKKKPTQMSGGQMQRVAIARALVNDPDILLADEPTGALDSTTSVQIMDILKEIAKEKLVIMVTHNGELAEEYSTRIIRLHDGLITSDSNPYSEEELKKDEKALLEKPTAKPTKKTSMSFFTALALSFNNLMTKKGRTILTAFAGSIGIIGIAMILALSNGIQTYIDQVQEETLSSYPVQIQEETTDLSSMLNGLMDAKEANGDHELDKVYSNSTVLELFNSLNKLGQVKNNLKAFKTFLTENQTLHQDYIAAIQYSYNLDLNIISIDKENDVTVVNPSELMNLIMEGMFGGSMSSMSSQLSSYQSMMGGGMQNNFCEIIPANDGGVVNDIIYNQYDLVYGDWPTSYDEMVLIVNENNEISDLALYSLGIKDQEEFKKLFENWRNNGENMAAEQTSYTYKEITELVYKLVLPTDYYTDQNNDGIYEDRREDTDYMRLVYTNAKPLKITGIIRPVEGATANALSGSIAYTYKLTEWYINQINDSQLVKDQKANPTIDVLSGLEFPTKDNIPQTKDEKVEKILKHINSLSDNAKVELYQTIYTTPTATEINVKYASDYSVHEGETEDKAIAMKNVLKEKVSLSFGENATEYIKMIDGLSAGSELLSYYRTFMKMFVEKELQMTKTYVYKYTIEPLPVEQKVAKLIELVNTSDENNVNFIYEQFIPTGLSASTYEDNLELLGVVDLDSPSSISIYAKDFHAKEEISKLIDAYNKSVSEDDMISYTDYVALIMSGISTIIDAISYVLIGFVSISLVVSSIMIGIITYISVLERTKEIGILRAIGASKRDVSRVFTAETIIEGLAAGMIGIGVTLLLCIPINLILYALSGIPGLKAELPISAAIVLVLISVVLTLIAGFFPSRLAAKKDPVEALRTE